ncbi:Putative transcriptional regulator, AraC family [Mycobacteroides abscessus subsp. abscessus]|nr:Putative transcriptional regulator, AraC family [Mycobacteroides abscessus subsp. abscessus]
MRRSVVILGFPGVQALDLVGPYEVFATSLAPYDRHYAGL